jgi:hypothetical protein
LFLTTSATHEILHLTTTLAALIDGLILNRVAHTVEHPAHIASCSLLTGAAVEATHIAIEALHGFAATSAATRTTIAATSLT